MYCGCGTGFNRLRWLLFIILFVTATVMAVVYCIEAKKCRCNAAAGHPNAAADLPINSFCREQVMHSCNLHSVCIFYVAHVFCR